MDSTPFSFDPLTLDFPALTLQCLEPPPTLFASTQHPTSTSWSILPPGPVQLEALRAYFREEFRRWKITCAAATAAATDELTYRPSLNAFRPDKKAEVRKAEEAAERMEKRVSEHIQAIYLIWSKLSLEQRDHLWKLELARNLGRKQKEVDKLKEGQHLLRQENANLKTQIEQLNRLQQPREFKIAPPSTMFVDEKLLRHMLEEEAADGKRAVGLNLADRSSDLNTIVSAAIDRWKHVIVSARSASAGLQAQRPLNVAATAEAGPGAASGGTMSAIQGATSQSQQQETRQSTEPPVTGQRHPLPAQAPSAAGGRATSCPAAASTATAARPPVVAAVATPSAAPSRSSQVEDEDEDEEMGDQDADADADADPDEDPDADADGDTDGDADADMDDDADAGMDHGDNYTDAQLQPVPPPPPQQHQHPQQPQTAVSTQAHQMGRLEVSWTRETVGPTSLPTVSGSRRIASDGAATAAGRAVHGHNLGQGHARHHAGWPGAQAGLGGMMRGAVGGHGQPMYTD
ncbi:hypothetical protein VTK56DRAFT_10007 [Thermocarpiscus australiensis]